MPPNPPEPDGADRPDDELVRAYVAGDRQAFELLYRRHRDRVFRVCRGIIGSDERAADVTQDVFVRLVRRIDRFDGRAAFTTWLHRVAVNACYDLLRARQVVPVPDILETADTAAPEADTATQLDVRRALGRLPPEQREVVVLHDIVGFRYEEISVMAQVPVGTVKSRLARGRLRLAEHLQGNRNRTAGSQRPMNVDGDADA